MRNTIDILVIEDHADTRRALVRLLAAKGYKTHAAPDGQQALQFLKDQIPRLIILDRMMPGMDGRQFLKIIRQNFSLQSIPVIDYSAAIEPYSPEESAQLGIHAHIPKGAGWEKLIEKIQEMLGSVSC